MFSSDDKSMVRDGKVAHCPIERDQQIESFVIVQRLSLTYYSI